MIVKTFVNVGLGRGDSPELDEATFWKYMLGMARQNPALLEQFLVVLAHNEHFIEYRSIVQREIREQVEALPPEEPTAQKELLPA